MNTEAALLAARWLHFASATTLFGLVVLPLQLRGVSTPHRRTIGAALSALVALSGLAWLGLITAQMAGLDPLALSLDDWSAVAAATTFGRVWVSRIAAATVLVALLLWRPSSTLPAVLGGLVLASIAAGGHGVEPAGALGWLHMAVDAVHLLAAGAWLGALGAFAAWLRPRPGSEDEDTLRRFAGLGVGLVAILVLTGVANTLLTVPDLTSLFHSAYGRVLLVKLAMFVAMVALAAVNRYALRARELTEAGSRNVRNRLIFEWVLGLAVLAAVSLLGTLDPAGDASA